MNASGAREKKWSKYTGVVFDARIQRWTCYTGGGGNKRFAVRNWGTEDEAALARNALMIERFGFDVNPNVVPSTPPTTKTFVTFADSNRRLILSLAAMQAAGGGSLYVRPRPGNNLDALRARLHKVASLVQDQPYVHALRFGSGFPFDVDLDGLDLGDVDLGVKWLTVTPRITGSRVVIHHTGKAPASDLWKSLVEQWGDAASFIGGHELKQALRAHSGCGNVLVNRANTYRVAAEWIASAKLFVGDSSIYSTIATGLGITVVLEGSKEFEALVNRHADG